MSITSFRFVAARNTFHSDPALCKSAFLHDRIAWFKSENVFIFVGNVAGAIYGGEVVDTELVKEMGSESVIQSLFGLLTYELVVKK